MKKKLFSLLLVAACLTGCGSNANGVVSASEDLQVFQQTEETTVETADVSAEQETVSAPEESAVTEATEYEVTQDDKVTEEIVLSVVSDQPLSDFDGPSDKLSDAIQVSVQNTEGDITDTVNGYESSSLNGRLGIERKKSGEDRVCYTISMDGAPIFFTTEFENYVHFNQYFQVKDTDGDGVEEILVANYTQGSATFVVCNFYVYKNVDGSWLRYAAYEPDENLPGDVDLALENSSNYADATIADVELAEGGIKVIADKGAMEDGVYMPDYYELIIR